jgi:hypothetical protein
MRGREFRGIDGADRSPERIDVLVRDADRGQDGVDVIEHRSERRHVTRRAEWSKNGASISSTKHDCTRHSNR